MYAKYLGEESFGIFKSKSMKSVFGEEVIAHEHF